MKFEAFCCSGPSFLLGFPFRNVNPIRCLNCQLEHRASVFSQHQALINTKKQQIEAGVFYWTFRNQYTFFPY